MHLSVERLMSTVALLALVLAIMPELGIANSVSAQPEYDAFQKLLSTLLNIWIIDMIAISVSVDHVSLTLSTIAFLCILPTALMISIGDYQMFMRVIVLAILTIAFVVARYIANSV